MADIQGKQRQPIQLITIDSQCKLEYYQGCKLSLNKIAKCLLIEPKLDTHMAVHRLHTEWKYMLVDPPPLCYAEPIGRNMYRWEAILMGPPKSPFEGTALFLDILISTDYPHSPPRIYFRHPIYHPNINENGHICADILERAWSPSFTISTTLISITSILSDPHFDDAPFNPEAAFMYNNNRENYDRIAKNSCRNHFTDREFQHLYFKFWFWQFGNLRKKLIDFNYVSPNPRYTKILMEDLCYPNDLLDHNWALIEKEAFNFIPSELIRSKPKMKRLHSLIIADERDYKKWFIDLLLTDNIEFIENNVEFRLCIELENKQLWHIYFQYLREKDTKKLLQLYSLYCRFFVDDLEVLEKYITGVEEFGPSLVPWKAPFDFEIFDRNVEFATISPKTKEPLSCHFTSNFVLPQNLPFKAPLIAYIVTKCSPQLLRKLFETCKYFYSRFSKPICYRLEISNEPEKQEAIEYKDSSAIINKTLEPNSKFNNVYIAKILVVYNEHDSFMLSKCLSCISQCQAKYISILNQKLTEAELKFLICSKKVVELDLSSIQIIDSADNKIGLEEILLLTPEIKSLSVDCIKYTPQTVDIIAEQPFTNKIQLFYLKDLSHEHLEPQRFAEFIEKNADKKAHFGVRFLEAVDEDYVRNFFDIVITDIRETMPEHERPHIYEIR